jgi:hypothetical protein
MSFSYVKPRWKAGGLTGFMVGDQVVVHGSGEASFEAPQRFGRGHAFEGRL